MADYLYSHVLPTPIKSPSITLFNSDLNSLLNCDIDLKNPLLLSGSLILEKSIPVSHNYSGHQFGLFVGQLGDGRVSTLFDLDTSHLKNKNIFNEIDEDKMLSKIEFSLKGIGKTPYSRDADGRIIFSATIREFLASEAMYYLGVPTSRAFSIAIGEELIERDIFFDGKITIENNAIISRLAPNFIRFGSFEKFITDVEFIGNSSEKMNKNNEMFESLINFLLDHDFNEIKNKFSEKKERYFEIYKEVIKRTAFLVAKWQSIGFCHGALNTDNMSILGITLDYGPFGFLEKTKNSYNPNYSDHAKRYNFVNQPGICAYNLVKLAEAMKFWINEKDAIEYLKNSYPKFYDKFYYENMRKKVIFLNFNYKNIINFNLSWDYFLLKKMMIKN